MNKNSFCKHIKDAIKINQIRKPLYAQLSNGKTKFLSNTIIAFQVCLLPIAKYFDFLGKKFNRKNIFIIQDDFVSMDNINSYDLDVLRRNVAKKEIFEMLKNKIKAYKKLIKSSFSFFDISKTTIRELDFIENLEHELSCNFIMLKHLLESIAYISLNSLNYLSLSNGKTIELSKKLINFHLFFLDKILFIDKTAQNFHQKNIGILINDIPHIPSKMVNKNYE
jgi:hypothetical protein